MKIYVLSTIAWVEKIAKKELERIGAKIISVQDRLITFSGDERVMIRANIWSRVGNKVYIQLAEKENVRNFDDLYDLIFGIELKKYFKKNFPIVIKTSSQRSQLDSAPAIQRISKKAVVDNLTDKSGEFIDEDQDLQAFEVLVLFIDDHVRILLNTSGKALHMRGYRQEAGEAPIKESLAAALVLLGNWKFKEKFYDPFCGAGTIPIEAAMIAKNIAPGLKRRFAFEGLGLVEQRTFRHEKAAAREKQFEGEYRIFWTDIDEEMVEIARENAVRAGVSKDVTFRQRDFLESFQDVSDLEGTLVSNPPYWERLEQDNLQSLYRHLNKIFEKNSALSGGIITSYEWTDALFKRGIYKKRKLYNGGEKCYFYKKL